MMKASLKQRRKSLIGYCSRTPKTIKTWPYPSNIHEELAKVLRDQGRFEEALREVSWVIDRHPYYFDAYLTRYAIHVELKQWREMLEDSETVIDLVRKKEKLETPDYITFYWAEQHHAYAWIRLGEYQKAEDEIRHMIRRAPKCGTSGNATGRESVLTTPGRDIADHAPMTNRITTRFLQYNPRRHDPLPPERSVAA